MQLLVIFSYIWLKFKINTHTNINCIALDYQKIRSPFQDRRDRYRMLTTKGWSSNPLMTRCTPYKMW
jgi:hypothetical protein